MDTRTFIVSSGDNSPREQLPTGSHPTRLVGFMDLGTQPGSEKYPAHKHKIRLSFEFPTELRVFSEEKGEQPFMVSKEFTNSLHSQGKLRPFLEGMLGRKIGDDEKLNILDYMGSTCMISIVHNDKGYAEIQGISKLPKGLECPAQINPTQIILEDDWDKNLPNLPKYLQDKIMGSDEYIARVPLTAEDWDILPKN